MQFRLVLLLTFFSTGAFSQALREYRSAANPYYWQHRKPDAAYWQQDVYYNISAVLDETNHTITASQQLEYWNNSPDTLRYLYFHLYQNAFVKGSYLHNLEEERNIQPRLGRYEAAGLGTVVRNIKANGTPVSSELDNTVLKVWLDQPLVPGAYTTLSMDFRTYFDIGGTRRRMKMYPAWGFMHYNGVQWFPKVCVYDRKFGWDTYQHLNKEFYGDFGVFDVSLDFASNYIVEATGALQNRAEVLPDTLRAKLDMKHFAKKPWNEPPSTIIPYVKGERKVWRFHAENVHDFAFTADPSYRIATTYWNGIECVGLAQEPHAAAWQNSADYVASIIRTFSTDIGMYAYPKMIAADAADGMEYPMLTLDGGGDPGYRGLLVHEIGHNWFYGMVGSNETYRAAMDEGFTQFLTAWGLERIDGPDLTEARPKHWWRRHFYEPAKVRDVRVFNSYLYNAINGEELPLNTHSNDFHDALAHEGGYGMVYYKTAAMLYNLQYTLGDSLFQAALRHYFDQWKMAHPYFEDFRNSVIQFTNADLNWFFDQWLETTKKADYQIKHIRKVRGTDSVTISFERKPGMQMPVDFTVDFKDGSSRSYHIPNTWFVKQTDATVLPKWYGWSKIQPRYTARIQAPAAVRSVRIDTSERLADVYVLDNYKRKGVPFHFESVKLKLDGGLNAPIDRRNYRLYVRPDLWWNPVDGIKAGLHAEGDFMRTMHRFSATAWFNTHVLQTDQYLSFRSEGWYAKYVPFNFNLSYQTPYSVRNTKHELMLQARILDGLSAGRVGHVWMPNDHMTGQLYFQTMWRPLSYDFDYLLYPQEWSSNRTRKNNSINLVLSRTYQHKKGFGSGTFHLRAPLLAGNDAGAFNYSFLQFTGMNTTYFGRLEVRSRIFGRWGMGNSVPRESALWLAGASPEDLMENKYTRSVGFMPDEWRGISRYETSHFHMGGGLNLRGYAGYFVADERHGELLIGYRGRSGASANLEIDFDNYIRLQPKFTRNWLHADVYGFADGGLIELSRISSVNEYYNSTPTTMWSDFRFDAGLGLALTIKKWWFFEKAKPLTFRFDVPLFLNRPPFANPQYTTFRYVVGINRAF